MAASAVWFLNFSTWDGVAGVYLEDLYVRPAFRRRGLARALLSALARECVEQGLLAAVVGRVELERQRHRTLRRGGRKPQTEWITYRVSGQELVELAGAQ